MIKTVALDKIVLNDTATIVYIDAFYRPDNWIKIAKDSYLQADGEPAYLQLIRNALLFFALCRVVYFTVYPKKNI